MDNSGQRLNPWSPHLRRADPHFTLGIFCLPAGQTIPLHDHPGMVVISRLLFGTMSIQVGASTLFMRGDYSIISLSFTSFWQAYDFVGDEQLHAQAMAGYAPSRSSSGSGPVAQAQKTGPGNVLSALGFARPSGRREALLRVNSTLTAPAEPLVLWPFSELSWGSWGKLSHMHALCTSGHGCLGPLAGCNVHEFRAETPCAVLDLLTPPYEAQQGGAVGGCAALPVRTNPAKIG